MEAGSAAKTTIWTPAYVALILVSFFNSMGQATAGTVLPLYANALGASTSLVGFVGGSFAVTALLVRPFAGPAFDSFSKKRLLVAFVLVNLVSMLLYSFVEGVGALIAVRLLHGVGMGCAAPLSLALVSENLPRERLSSGVSVYTIAQAAAMAVGPAFGIWLARVAGYPVVFVATAASLACALVVLALFVREPQGVERLPYQLKLSRAFSRRAVGPAAVLMLLGMSFSCTSSFVAIYGGLRGIEEIGLYFTVYAVCLFATRPLFGKLSDRFGTTRVLVPSIACFMTSFVLIAQAQTLAGFVVAAVVAACGFGVANPLVQALVFKCVPPEQRGSASNTSFVGLDLGNLAGPYLAGHVVEALVAGGVAEPEAYAAMWLVMLVPIACGLVAFLAMRGRLARYADLERTSHG